MRDQLDAAAMPVLLRLVAASLRQRHAGGMGRCADPWHGNAITPRVIDYRRAIAPLLPPGVAPPGPELAPPADRCPTCAASRPRITVVAVDMPAAASPGVSGRLTPHEAAP
jgi:hypothetical protein